MNKELKYLCEHLIIGSISHTDFLIKVSKLIEGASVEEARELARTVLLSRYEFIRKD